MKLQSLIVILCLNYTYSLKVITQATYNASILDACHKVSENFTGVEYSMLLKSINEELNTINVVRPNSLLKCNFVDKYLSLSADDGTIENDYFNLTKCGWGETRIANYKKAMEVSLMALSEKTLLNGSICTSSESTAFKIGLMVISRNVEIGNRTFVVFRNDWKFSRRVTEYESQHFHDNLRLDYWNVKKEIGSGNTFDDAQFNSTKNIIRVEFGAKKLENNTPQDGNTREEKIDRPPPDELKFSSAVPSYSYCIVLQVVALLSFCTEMMAFYR